MDNTKLGSNVSREGLSIDEVEDDGSLIRSCGGGNCTTQLCTEGR